MLQYCSLAQHALTLAHNVISCLLFRSLIDSVRQKIAAKVNNNTLKKRDMAMDCRSIIIICLLQLTYKHFSMNTKGRLNLKVITFSCACNALMYSQLYISS